MADCNTIRDDGKATDSASGTKRLIRCDYLEPLPMVGFGAEPGKNPGLSVVKDIHTAKQRKSRDWGSEFPFISTGLKVHYPGAQGALEGVTCVEFMMADGPTRNQIAESVTNFGNIEFLPILAGIKMAHMELSEFSTHVQNGLFGDSMPTTVQDPVVDHECILVGPFQEVRAETREVLFHIGIAQVYCDPSLTKLAPIQVIQNITNMIDGQTMKQGFTEVFVMRVRKTYPREALRASPPYIVLDTSTPRDDSLSCLSAGKPGTLIFRNLILRVLPEYVASSAGSHLVIPPEYLDVNKGNRVRPRPTWARDEGPIRSTTLNKMESLWLTLLEDHQQDDHIARLADGLKYFPKPSTPSASKRHAGTEAGGRPAKVARTEHGASATISAPAAISAPTSSAPVTITAPTTITSNAQMRQFFASIAPLMTGDAISQRIFGGAPPISSGPQAGATAVQPPTSAAGVDIFASLQAATAAAASTVAAGPSANTTQTQANQGDAVTHGGNTDQIIPLDHGIQMPTAAPVTNFHPSQVQAPTAPIDTGGRPSMPPPPAPPAPPIPPRPAHARADLVATINSTKDVILAQMAADKSSMEQIGVKIQSTIEQIHSAKDNMIRQVFAALASAAEQNTQGAEAFARLLVAAGNDLLQTCSSVRPGAHVYTTQLMYQVEEGIPISEVLRSYQTYRPVVKSSQAVVPIIKPEPGLDKPETLKNIVAVTSLPESSTLPAQGEAEGTATDPVLIDLADEDDDDDDDIQVMIPSSSGSKPVVGAPTAPTDNTITIGSDSDKKDTDDDDDTDGAGLMAPAGDGVGVPDTLTIETSRLTTWRLASDHEKLLRRRLMLNYNNDVYQLPGTDIKHGSSTSYRGTEFMALKANMAPEHRDRIKPFNKAALNPALQQCITRISKPGHNSQTTIPIKWYFVAQKGALTCSTLLCRTIDKTTLVERADGLHSHNLYHFECITPGEGGEMSKTRTYFCPWCTAITSGPDQMALHIRRDHYGLLTICGECNKTATMSIDAMRRHWSKTCPGKTGQK